MADATLRRYEMAANENTSHLDVLERLKRGSVQLELAAFKASGGLGARYVMTGMVILGLVLSGLIESSATVALMALSNPLTSAEFAEYVANTSYVTRYCEPINDTEPDEQPVFTNIVHEEFDYEDEMFENITLHGRGHGRNIIAFPKLKVPLSEEDNVDSLLREAFLWGAVPIPLVASYIAYVIGPKRVVGGGILVAGLLTLLVPLVWFSPFHMTIRVLQGGLLGASWPALHMLAVQWFPTLQRTTFVSCYSSLSVGFASAGLLGTPLVQMFGRDVLCYILGLLSITWVLFWWRLVHDSPATHPRLTSSQRVTLQSGVGKVRKVSEEAPPPWHQLLTSPPVWACAVATLGSEWGQATLHLAATKYLKLVYGYALTYDRVLSVLPFYGHFLAALLFGQVADHVRKEGLASTTTTRKVLVYISHFLPAAILFVLGYTGCDPSAPAAMFAMAVVTSGATSAGVYSSAIDIAPNHAGAVFGLSQTVGGAGSLIAAYVVREGLHGSLPMSWRVVFGVAATVLLVTASVFMVLGSGSLQLWNKVGVGGVELVEVFPVDDVNIVIVVEDTDKENEAREEEEQQEALKELEEESQKLVVTIEEEDDEEDVV